MASSLSLWFSIPCSPRCSWRSIWYNTLFAVCLRRSDELWIYDQLIYKYYLNLLWIILCMIWYLCKSPWTIDLVWPTRLVFLAMGQVLGFGFNLAVLDPSDSKGNEYIKEYQTESKRSENFCWFFWTRRQPMGRRSTWGLLRGEHNPPGRAWRPRHALVGCAHLGCPPDRLFAL